MINLPAIDQASKLSFGQQLSILLLGIMVALSTLIIYLPDTTIKSQFKTERLYRLVKTAKRAARKGGEYGG